MKLDLPREREFNAGIWYSTHASTWYPAHHHEELELKIVLWGKTAYDVGAQRVTLEPGSLLWLAPGQSHTLVDASNDLAMWVASFRPIAVHSAEQEAGARVLDGRMNWGSCVLPSAQLRELSRLTSEAAQHHQPQEFNQMAHHLLLGALPWCHSCELPDNLRPSNANDVHHPAVARAVAMVRELDGNLSLQSVARRCGLSPARLSRLFKQQMGLSLVQFRSHLRVQRFISQFGRGESQNMLEAAIRSGFGSYQQFHRAFWQVTGYGPSEHLRRVRAGVVIPAGQGNEAKSSGGR